MTQIPHNGKIYDFPDDTQFNDIQKFFSSESPENKNDERVNKFMNETGVNRTLVDTARDLGAGALQGGQNMAALLGEAGQGIGDIMQMIPGFGALQKGAQKATGIQLPDVNIRNELGLGNENPVNAKQLISGKNANPFVQAMGQFLPGALAGGTSLPGQMASNALYAGTQASPQEQNANGILPQGRPGAMIEGGVMGALPFAMKGAGNVIKSVAEKFMPSKSYNALLESTGGGKNVTENIQELGNRIQYGNKSAKEEALIPKREMMQESGESLIIPEQNKSKKLVDNISDIFSENESIIDPAKKKSITSVIKKYYQDGDIDSLIEKGEDIFNHPGLTEKNILNLEEMLIPEKPLKGNYLKIQNASENYSDILRDAHNSYEKNPTFRNSDKLRSRLFKRINELSGRVKSKTITDAGEKELNSLIKNRQAIIADQDKFISKLSPDNQKKYGKFNKLWREDVQAYEDANTTIKNIKNGHLKNVTPDKLTNAFAFPELNPEMQKVLKDIGPSGINNIIFNELGRTTSAKEALKVLENLENNKGFSTYITPEIRNHMNQLRNRIKNKNALLWGAGISIPALLGSGALYKAGKRATT